VRLLLWLGLILGVLCGIVAPATYLYAASQLPPLENEFDLERHLRTFVEGERMSLQMGQAAKQRGGVTYARPDFAQLPKDLVALYIDQWNCPTFFQTPREEGMAWSWRVFATSILNRPPPGDGQCEWQFASQLASDIRLRSGLRQSIAASRIHEFLTKDQLVAYDLSALYFERSVVGVEEASQVLFKKRLDALSLSELAELELALPPNGFYQELKNCKTPSLIRQARDILLAQLSRHGLVAEDRARGAQAAPLACTR